MNRYILLALFWGAVANGYVLDTSEHMDLRKLVVQCPHYEQEETFTCGSTAVDGIPPGDRNGNAGYWTTCDRTRNVPCQLSYYRVPNSWVARSITLEVFHNGDEEFVDTNIRVTTSNPLYPPIIFRASNRWATHVINASIFPDMERLDYMHITAEPQVDGFVVFDRVTMDMVDFISSTTTPPTTTTTTPGTGPTTTMMTTEPPTTTSTIPTTTAAPTCRFQGHEDPDVVITLPEPLSPDLGNNVQIWSGTLVGVASTVVVVHNHNRYVRQARNGLAYTITTTNQFRNFVQDEGTNMLEQYVLLRCTDGGEVRYSFVFQVGA